MISSTSSTTTAAGFPLSTGNAQVFSGHEGDVNGIAFLPSGMGLGTAGDDASCKIFDLR